MTSCSIPEHPSRPFLDQTLYEHSGGLVGRAQGRSPRGAEEGSILGSPGACPRKFFGNCVWNEQILTSLGQKFQVSPVCSAMSIIISLTSCSSCNAGVFLLQLCSVPNTLSLCVLLTAFSFRVVEALVQLVIMVIGFMINCPTLESWPPLLWNRAHGTQKPFFISPRPPMRNT